jgi:hypothetical protein
MSRFFRNTVAGSSLLIIGLLNWFVQAPLVPARAADTHIRPGNFSEMAPGGSLPPPWQPLTFKRIEQHTRYELVRDEEGRTVVAAHSMRSASGLIRKMTIDPRKFQTLSWRWKVSNVYANGDLSRKKGDDYPARIYITFAYDPDQVGFFEKAKYEAARLLYGETPPLAAISYIWANRAPVGLVTENAYTDRLKMIVVQSGPEQTGQWRAEKRNIYSDFKQAFGREPTHISGVAIMTDADNTGESARAWYGDIVFTTE